MEKVLVDARNKPCPEPVLMTKRALDAASEGDVVVALVDNEVSRDNVLKLAQSQRAGVEVKQQDTEFEITIEKGHWEKEIDVKLTMQEDPLGDYSILLSRDTLGEGAKELGVLLLKSYLYSLAKAQWLPGSLLLVNRGVFVALRGSTSLDTLKTLEARGVEILACGTCLDYYDLRESLAVGKVTNMYEIVERTTRNRTVTL